MVKRLEFDWVVVQVGAVRKIVAVGLTVILAALLLAVGYRLLHQPLPVQARKAIERAESARRAVAQKKLPKPWRSELAQADGQLEQARSDYQNERWQLARDNADSARRRFEVLLGAGQREVAGVGQIVSLEGRVSVQRAGKSGWSSAHARQPLFNGDFVKTGSDGVAEILFADGTLYRMDPGSLLEISKPQRASGTTDVAMVAGQIDVSTSDQEAHVATDSARAVIDKDSRVRLGIRPEDKKTVVAAFHGGARVRSSSGRGVELEQGELVEAAADGSLSEKKRLPQPPRLLEPQPNATFELGKDSVITLRWALPPEGERSHLQVSRSRLFLPLSLDVDSLRDASTAHLRPVQKGLYFWRVAAVNEDGLQSDWSAPRRFRIVGDTAAAALVDLVPPPLELKPLQQLGHLFIVEGQTEPGALVTVNGEEVEVEGDGHFRKTVEATQPGWNELQITATDPAGNQTTKQERVFVEVF